jgi:hypothetical protein
MLQSKFILFLLNSAVFFEEEGELCVREGATKQYLPKCMNLGFPRMLISIAGPSSYYRIWGSNPSHIYPTIYESCTIYRLLTLL